MLSIGRTAADDGRHGMNERRRRAAIYTVTSVRDATATAAITADVPMEYSPVWRQPVPFVCSRTNWAEDWQKTSNATI